MPLMCDCDLTGDEDWIYFTPQDYTTAPVKPKRRRRCCSCRELIDHGATCAEFDRWRGPKTEIEARIYGCDFGDMEINIASWWLCETCADLYFSLAELGFCNLLGDDLRETVKEYAAQYGQAGGGMSTYNIETDTTIRGGLPVTVTGAYSAGYAGSYWEPPEPASCEDICLYWPRRRFADKLRLVPETDKHGEPFVSEDDYERVEEALLLAATEDWV